MLQLDKDFIRQSDKTGHCPSLPVSSTNLKEMEEMHDRSAYPGHWVGNKAC